jgi:hypothetical protein
MVSTGITRPGLVTGHAASAGALTLAAALQQQPQLFAAAVLEVPFVDLLGGISCSAAGLQPLGAGTESDMHLLTRHEYDEWGNPEDPGVLQMMQRLCPYQGLLQRLTPEQRPLPSTTPSSGSSTSTSPSTASSTTTSTSSRGAAEGVAASEPEGGDKAEPLQEQRDCLAGPLPALLLTAGDEDARVPYWMPLRYAAAARAAGAAGTAAAGARSSADTCRTTGLQGSPVYVQVQEGGGHFSQGLLSQDTEEEAEVLAFLLHQVGTSRICADS